jgi:hypothetical protein
MKIKLAILAAFAITFTALCGDIVIYPNGINTNTIVGTSCPNGTFIASATYARTLANGWGWAPDTNHFSYFSASYTNQSGVVVQFGGKSGDTGCNSPTVAIANPPYSAKYRFTVYWPVGSTVPTSTNNAPLILTNFLP